MSPFRQKPVELPAPIRIVPRNCLCRPQRVGACISALAPVSSLPRPAIRSGTPGGGTSRRAGLPAAVRIAPRSLDSANRAASASAAPSQRFAASCPTSSSGSRPSETAATRGRHSLGAGGCALTAGLAARGVSATALSGLTVASEAEASCFSLPQASSTRALASSTRAAQVAARRVLLMAQVSKRCRQQPTPSGGVRPLTGTEVWPSAVVVCSAGV